MFLDYVFPCPALTKFVFINQLGAFKIRCHLLEMMGTNVESNTTQIQLTFHTFINVICYVKYCSDMWLLIIIYWNLIFTLHVSCYYSKVNGWLASWKNFYNTCLCAIVNVLLILLQIKTNSPWTGPSQTQLSVTQAETLKKMLMSAYFSGCFCVH